MSFPVPSPDRGRRQTVAVFAVAAFDVFVAAAVAAVFVAVDMFALVLCHLFPSGDSTVTVTALQSGRSPHGEGQCFPHDDYENGVPVRNEALFHWFSGLYLSTF